MNPRACNTFGCLHLICLQMVELKCCLKHHFWLLRFYEEVIQILGGKHFHPDFFFEFSPRKLGVEMISFDVFSYLSDGLVQPPTTRWWQLKYFSCSSLFGEMIRFDYIIFFKWVGSTTNEVYSHCNAGVGRSVAAACGYLTYALGQVDDEIVSISGIPTDLMKKNLWFSHGFPFISPYSTLFFLRRCGWGGEVD